MPKTPKTCLSIKVDREDLRALRLYSVRLGRTYSDLCREQLAPLLQAARKSCREQREPDRDQPAA